MNEYLNQVNASYFYVLVALVLTFVTIMCFVFLIKSYKAGLKIGMDKTVLKKTIISSATFTLLPSISILLGVVALSGTLGVPLSWLRLSVIGSLQYELNVASIAAEAAGLAGLVLSELNIEAFVTIALLMTVCILGGIMCCIFFLKPYLKQLEAKPKKEEGAEKKPDFGAHATSAMFVGLCSAYIGTYVGSAVQKDFMPLIVALISGAVMAVFEYLIAKKNMKQLENFSLAASMLVAMVCAVFVAGIL